MKWFEDMKISKKLIFGFLIVALISIAVGAVGIFNIMRITQSSRDLYKNDTQALQFVGSSGLNFQQLRYDAIKLSAIDLTDPAVRTPVTDEMTALIPTITDGLNKVSTIKLNPAASKLLVDLQTNWGTYRDAVTKSIDSVKTGDATFLNQTKPANAKLGAAIRDQYQQVYQAISDQAASESTGTNSIAKLAEIIMIAVVAVGIVISIILGISISRSIAEPIDNVVLVTSMLAKGDMNIEKVLTPKIMLYNKRKDEIGKLARAIDGVVAGTKEQLKAALSLADGDLTVHINIRSDEDELGKGLIEMASKFNEVVSTIITASDQVASGSSLVSNSSSSLSQGATLQASSVQELTASLEQIASQTNASAQNAVKANDLTKDAKINAANGNVQMQDMLKAMDEINISSSNINKIIKVIDDIAFQTNILALNAAVEAARAGQHGKGFAVVAEEVRTLASRSANAAKETTDMIESSIRKVNSGTKIANETAEALKHIVTQVEQASDLVNAIAQASTEQAIGIEQINRGILQVSQVVQTNAATAEESAAASEELTNQAAQLKEITSIFKVKSSTLSAYGDSSGSLGTASAEFKSKRPGRSASSSKIMLTENDLGKY